MDKKILMCDSHSLSWCGRISLLLTFCIVLCTMMFQIWSYYFSLVAQMDTLVIDAPKVAGIVHYCDGQVIKAWNVEDCTKNTSTISCKSYGRDGNIFLDVNGFGNVSFVDDVMTIQPLDACLKVMYWILPW